MAGAIGGEQVAVTWRGKGEGLLVCLCAWEWGWGGATVWEKLDAWSEAQSKNFRAMHYPKSTHHGEVGSLSDSTPSQTGHQSVRHVLESWS